MAPKKLNEAAEDKKTIVAEVKRAGEAIMIPENITIDEAIEVLVQKSKEEEQVVGLNCKFDAFVWEGCYALAKALDSRFGWFKQMITPGSFFEPDQPPALYSVAISPDETVQVPWGRFLIPTIDKGDGYMQTGYHVSQTGMVCFQLSAQIRRKHSRQFDELCKEVKAQLKAGSLYKGKAISIKFRDSDGDKIDFPEPVFPRIATVDPKTVIFNRDVEAQLNANLYTPITKTARCRKEKIPLKRGVLLYGPFGTGKTMLATLTCGLAVKNDWTFMFCQRADDFSDCVEFARQYQPAVVFCEDIDRTTDGERDDELDHILNTIDGVASKGSEILLVLTTNEVENIYQGMLRPGRLDAVIEVKRPDAEAVERLIRLYGGELIDEDADLTQAGMLLAGATPSVVREVVERAKLSALSLSDDELKLTAPALVISGKTMQAHLALLDRKPNEEPHAMEILGNAVATHLVAAMQTAVREAPSLKRLVDSSSDELLGVS